MSQLVHSIAEGVTVVSGGNRLSPDEEKALNALLGRAAGFEGGMQLYKLGWAMEDNSASFDSVTGQYKYDPNKVPLCIEPNQASYHLLSWSPPNATDMMYEDEFKGEDLSRGTYNCIFHFLTPEGEPINPTASLIEVIIPVIKELHEIATATRKGFLTTRDRLRRKKIDEIKAKQAQEEKAYAQYAENLLESTAPAFEGNPTSFAGPKRKSFSDLRPGERQRAGVVLTDRDDSAPAAPDAPADTTPVQQPVSFSFSARTPKAPK